MLAGLLTTFRHELVSAVLVSAFLGVIAMPPAAAMKYSYHVRAVFIGALPS